MSTVTLAWAAIYAYVCVYFLLVFQNRRSERQYLYFGLLCGALGLYTVGSALWPQAGNSAEALLLQRVEALGLLLGIPMFVDFAGQLVPAPRRFSRFAYGWAILGMALLMTDVFYAPDAYLGVHYRMPFAPAQHRVPVTAFGQVYLGIGFALGTVVCGAFLANAVSPKTPIEERLRLRIIASAAALNVLTGAHDVALRAGWIHSLPLVEHSAMPFVLAMCFVLLDGFAKASQQLSLRTAELRGSYNQLRRTQQRLVRQEQLAAVGELSAVIAHEVRNPLAVIKNSVSGLRREHLREEDRRTLHGILDEETTRLNQLMHDLLAYAQPVVPRGRSLVVSELLRRSVERACSALEAEDLNVAYDLNGPEEVFGDPELLRHALVNVIENGVQAMGGKGTLTVSSGAAQLGAQPAVALRFQDTGEGMEAAVQNRAIRPFFTTRSTGTGLGLAIVDRVVANHSGTVDIASSPGEGTTITLTLPLEATPLTEPPR